MPRCLCLWQDRQTGTNWMYRAWVSRQAAGWVWVVRYLPGRGSYYKNLLEKCTEVPPHVTFQPVVLPARRSLALAPFGPAAGSCN